MEYETKNNGLYPCCCVGNHRSFFSDGSQDSVCRKKCKKYNCDKFHSKKAVRFSALKYMDQEWMVNIPLYAVCNL